MKDNQAKYPQLRFKGFTDPWEERKLGELANIVRGASPRPIQDPKWFDKDSDIGWLRISDVTEQDGRIRHLEQRISKLGQEKTRVLMEPHLLLSIAATVGKPLVNYVKTGVHDGFLIFLNPVFDREFMFQWLDMFRPKWKKYGQPGSQVNLNSELVRNQEIDLPRIEEQQQIGSFFKQLDDIIALHQRKLAKLKELKQGYLQKLFPRNGSKFPQLRFAGFADDWEQRKLGELGNVTTGKAFSSNEFDQKGEYLVITNKDISDSSRSQNVLPDRINVSDEKLINKYNLSGNNILVTMDGVNLGKTAKFSNDKALLAQRVGRIQSNQLEFIYQVTASPEFLLTMRTLSVGNAIKHISLQQISNYTSFVPNSKAEQQKIGSFFKQLDSTIALHQRKLDLLKEQKKGFLQKMFV